MTEDEAKTKWCPFLRSAGRTGFGANAATNFSTVTIERGGFNCCGSACMAWRVVVPLVEDKTLHGYCGLAGKP